MQAALRSSAITVRNAFLQHLRLTVAATSHRVPILLDSRVSFSSDHGTYLDKSSVTDRILELVKKMEKVDPAKVTPQASFQGDLGLDSLDTVEVVMAIEEEFALEIPDAEADKISSCAEAIEYVAAHPRAK
ncbi:acyl carrier protein [Marchantia polymorpha subsp. ruderalis]|uniref:Acyl carrier protein n=2 Tax=Marchantia polymorpha TaxID=3197 RepID=A0A176WHH9_MARPO|nr:hypothetical protein AXG93_3242s1620 [Marchantia polymorpha subsp. ruderalis]PTQ44007.1 hypothetical protein MARPO_0022s0108 [Marchantia polymorpha]BBN04397.1 hypothetical protein Mp_3g04230 [Marchantia polymorpha subsp. ruderalis]|eukprot:PTQ44007.1 hypothetical protein MARPO_0022s0108 [Marchantia polymorpha]